MNISKINCNMEARKCILFFITDEVTLHLSEAKKCEVNDDKEYVKFFDDFGNTVALIKLNDMRGFYKTNDVGAKQFKH